MNPPITLSTTPYFTIEEQGVKTSYKTIKTGYCKDCVGQCLDIICIDILTNEQYIYTKVPYDPTYPLYTISHEV